MTRGEEILDWGAGRVRRERKLSPFLASIFPFPPETPDTQAITARGLCSANYSI